MKITSIRIKKNHSSETLLGTASVQLDDCLVIHDIKLIKLDGKRIISFPSKKVKKYKFNGSNYTENFEYSDIVHPSNSEFRQYIQDELYKIYDMETEKGDINYE